MKVEFPTERRFDVIPLGRATIDINTKDVRYTFTETPILNRYVGGSPANTAIGLARLGARVGFIGKVSADPLGRYVTSALAAEGVDVSNLTECQPGICLGLAFTEAMEDGHTNLVLYREGRIADLHLAPADIRPDYVASTRCLILSGTALSASPSREAAFVAVAIAKEHGVKIVFDIDYRPQSWANAGDAGLYASFVADQSDIIMGAREEFDLLASRERSSEEDERTAERAFAQGTELVIIKHGSDGSRAYSRSGDRYHVGVIPVTALKSTGGGDAYSSALIYGLLTGRGLRDSLGLATASASMVIGAPSCSAAMPRLAQIEDFIKSSGLRMDEVVEKL